jgi:hypothetical protein
MEPDQHDEAEKDINITSESVNTNDEFIENNKKSDDILDDKKTIDKKCENSPLPVIVPCVSENLQKCDADEIEEDKKEEKVLSNSGNSEKIPKPSALNETCEVGGEKSESKQNEVQENLLNSSENVDKKDEIEKESIENSKEAKCDDNEQTPLNADQQNDSTEHEAENKNGKLPLFPGTVTKSVPGSNEVKLEIATSSLFDRVIMYSLKNNVVDNSRLDAVKGKYLSNNGNTNSNGSDSNSSSKSVEKLIEEFKGNCKPPIESNVSITPHSCSRNVEQDINDECENANNGANTNTESIEIVSANKMERSVIKDELPTSSSSPPSCSSSSLSTTQHKHVNTENEALDFRESPPKNVENLKIEDEEKQNETQKIQQQSQQNNEMLDLSVKRDEKSIPPIKRSHALYVGIPDFSKQIFTAPSVTRTTNTLPRSSNVIGPPRVRNPDFSNVTRAPELQMRHPDFSKGFAKTERSTTPTNTNVQITPSNFPEIARRNNYISDLQLKPTTSSYKIDYKPTPNKEAEIENFPVTYPNRKKENINAYNQQQQMIVEEPMAHVIHKNQIPSSENHLTPHHHHHHLNNRSERLLGGSSQYELPSEKRIPGPSHAFNHNNPNTSSCSNSTSNNPQAYSYKETSEFSLKQKEQQLRQEGTIITIKNENMMKMQPERHSADLFRDLKLKQPKESPDTINKRMSEPPPLTFHQQYPDFPINHPHTSAIKINSSSPQMQEYQSNSRNYHTPSPSSSAVSINHHHNQYHHLHRQQKSPLTILPQSSSSMNPPQNWPQTHLNSQHTTRMHGTSHVTVQQQYPQQLNFNKIPLPQNPISQSSASNYTNYPQHHPHSQQMQPPTQKTNQLQMYKYPEPSTSRMHSEHNEHSRSPAPNQNYYHNKYPDFSRKFDSENANYYHDQQLQQRPVRNFVETKAHAIESHRLSTRNDLEIRTIPPSTDHLHHRTPYSPSHSMQHQVMPVMSSSHSRQQENSMQYARIDNERPRVPPDLKIEKRNDDIQKPFATIPIRHKEATPELSILPKIKTEPISSPVVNYASGNITLIKSSKSVFAEVKRESALDLSVKTVKTKADSTGCDQDFQSRIRNDFKVEFMPNFNNVAKTDCRQQARLGPQDFGTERSVQVIGNERQVVPARFSKETEPPRNPLNVSIPPVAYEKRSHAASKSTDFSVDRQMPFDSQLNRPQVITSNRNYENSNSHSNDVRNYHQKIQPPQAIVNNSVPRLQHGLVDQKMPAQSRDPLTLERERDRRYVEEILYGRNRNVHEQRSSYQLTQSPPRKRPYEMHAMINHSIPTKQVRIDEMPKAFPSTSNSQQPDYNCQSRHDNYQARIAHPPLLTSVVSSKHYPDPRKDAIKSAEMMSYSKNISNNNKSNSNNSNSANYYPNPKAEMIHRSDPNSSNYAYHQKYIHPHQNFHQRPDDTRFPPQARLAHPVQMEIGIKVEQLTSTGPLLGNEILGEQHKLQQHMPLNGMLMPASLSGSNGNISRGADQSTIQKLKSNLEFKEQQKMKIVQKYEEEHQNKDLSPRQFRTKGELKGYHPLPLPANMIDVSKSQDSPAAVATSISSSFDLLDWGSACNDFVVQLQTGKKRTKRRHPRNDGKHDEKLSSRMPGTVANDLSSIPKEILQSISQNEKNSSSDEDKTLLELKNREKQRHETEQKFAARLGRPSSSESETDTRKMPRGVQRVRRLRKRAMLGIRKTDDEHSIADEGEGETDDDVQAKERSSKTKLDDLTSSDDESKKKFATLGEKKSIANAKKEIDSKKCTANKNAKKLESSSDSTDTSENDNDDDDDDDNEDNDDDEKETTEDKINKLSSAKNKKRLKDLGDTSNIKVLLEEGETMTRSKRKLEIEKKLSNSKILRNEKVVQNVLPDKKKGETSPPAKKLPLKRKVPESESEKDVGQSSNKKKLKNNKNSSSDETEVEEESKTER